MSKTVKICKKCSGINEDALINGVSGKDVVVRTGCIGHCSRKEEGKIHFMINGVPKNAETQEEMLSIIDSAPYKKKGKKNLLKILLAIVALTVIVSTFFVFTSPTYAGDPSKFKRTFTQEELKKIDTNFMTLDEVSRFNGKDGARAYVVIKDVVYDVTNKWKNGEHHGLKAGNDLTEAFLKAHHGLELFKNLTPVARLRK